ncbi:anthranilate synthase component II [Helicobacter pametensis]|uniref:anthranilate synthase component II n=1 Tax=Helicobacter pametensis TaxID=95149 RepID=UPI00048465FA|nr:aminodeoxychorismate/anthranilate synthase component II [Helicobacter pametensis]
MIALIDNHDSFTYNLIYLLEELSQEICVFFPQDLVWDILEQATHIIISPGPRHPRDTPINQEVILNFYIKKPILGVCLGHQCIAHAFGGEVIQGRQPIHGKTSQITFKSNPLFEGLSQNLEVMRYHSLVVQNLPNELEAIAWSEDEVIMALRHKIFPLYGVQFHPESILSQGGSKLLQNFLQIHLDSRLSYAMV